jgi:hypothetical protein
MTNILFVEQSITMTKILFAVTVNNESEAVQGSTQTYPVSSCPVVDPPKSGEFWVDPPNTHQIMR